MGHLGRAEAIEELDPCAAFPLDRQVGVESLAARNRQAQRPEVRVAIEVRSPQQQSIRRRGAEEQGDALAPDRCAERVRLEVVDQHGRRARAQWKHELGAQAEGERWRYRTADDVVLINVENVTRIRVGGRQQIGDRVTRAFRRDASRVSSVGDDCDRVGWPADRIELSWGVDDQLIERDEGSSRSRHTRDEHTRRILHRTRINTDRRSSRPRRCTPQARRRR